MCEPKQDMPPRCLIDDPSGCGHLVCDCGPRFPQYSMACNQCRWVDLAKWYGKCERGIRRNLVNCAEAGKAICPLMAKQEVSDAE